MKVKFIIGFMVGLIFSTFASFLEIFLSCIAIAGFAHDIANDVIKAIVINLFIIHFSKYLIFYNNNVSIDMLQMQHVAMTTYFI